MLITFTSSVVIVLVILNIEDARGSPVHRRLLEVVLPSEVAAGISTSRHWLPLKLLLLLLLLL